MAKKIPVSASQTSLQQNPFARLDIGGLPPGPEKDIVPEPPVESVRGKPKVHRVVLRREKAQRGGKTVVIVSQLPTHLSPPELENLCRDARKSLGCGGTVVNREIELQGDQPDRVRAFFEKIGYQVGGV